MRRVPCVLLSEIDLEAIIENPYNSRRESDASEIGSLAKSLDQLGQLAAVRVRASRTQPGKYELVFGHRRVLGAKKLGWKTIRAEVMEMTDEQMVLQSLAENVSRSDLSDFEKGTSFDVIHRQFNKTYDEIGKLTGFAKTHICNYVRMTKLFDKAFFERK
jgi:ParB/RepB/Spo0J family partition protein